LLKKIRTWQPDIILNDRLEIDQDIKTPEQFQPQEWLKIDGKPVVWETCQTFSGSWGYHRDETSWKSE
jgi:alpha-L-fucosidase